jgi:hypothetical protein
MVGQHLTGVGQPDSPAGLGHQGSADGCLQPGNLLRHGPRGVAEFICDRRHRAQSRQLKQSAKCGATQVVHIGIVKINRSKLSLVLMRPVGDG